MDERQIIHIVDPESRLRAEIAELVVTLGHHAEGYGGIEQAIDAKPERGIMLAGDREQWGGIPELIRKLAGRSVWLPVIAMAPRPTTARVVTAIRSGALDYLPLPLARDALGEAIDRAAIEAEEHAMAWRRRGEARKRIAALTRREREVLDQLTGGRSNKALARALAISPRTVEIHRANMMAKLGAKHPADAVRIRLDARK